MKQPIPTTQPGPNGPVVSHSGLGAMGISDLCGDAGRTESIATLHAALDPGVTLIDTGDSYGSGNKEMLIEETIGARAEVQQAGYIRHIGLSEVGAPALRRSAAIAPISDLQIEYSLLSRGPEDTIK
jgi:aryl-alcohol dehydrogenase-like predicted oxidoreductase